MPAPDAHALPRIAVVAGDVSAAVNHPTRCFDAEVSVASSQVPSNPGLATFNVKAVTPCRNDDNLLEEAEVVLTCH